MDTEQPNPQAPQPVSPPPPETAPVTPVAPTPAPPQTAFPTIPQEVAQASPNTFQSPAVVQPVVPTQEPLPQPVVQQPPLQAAETVSPSLASLSQLDNSAPVTPQATAQVTGPQMKTPMHEQGGRKLPFGKFSVDRRKIALLVVAVLFAFVSAVAVYFVLANRSSEKKVSDLEKQIALLSADTHDLPEGAIQVSECIPNMGFHYIDPDSDPRFGPYYLVNKQGKVIGFEYMFNNTMLTSIPAGIDLEVLLTDGPISLHGWQYESIEFARSPSGHPGFTEDHVDVHVYTVTPEEQKKSCE